MCCILNATYSVIHTIIDDFIIKAIIYSGLNSTKYPFKLSSTSSNNGFSFFRSISIWHFNFSFSAIFTPDLGIYGPLSSLYSL